MLKRHDQHLSKNQSASFLTRLSDWFSFRKKTPTKVVATHSFLTEDLLETAHALQPDHTQPEPAASPLVKRGLKHYFSYGVIIAGIMIMTSSVTLYAMTEPPLLSPISAESTFQFLSQTELPTSNKVVYGFVPYWNVAKMKIQPELTHLSYFGLHMTGDGSLLIRDENGPHIGYSRMQGEAWLNLVNEMQDQNSRIDIVLVQFDNDTIIELISNPNSVDNLLSQLDSVILSYPITGVNIDIEYTGEVTDGVRDKFATFVEKLSSGLKQKYNGIEVSIDVYASAADDNQIWDMTRVSAAVDYVVVMAYDFHRRSSPLAGPVAPLFGGKEYWSSDISTYLQKFIEFMPREKILLGVPFYGYGWQTTGREPQAKTYPDSGFTASFDTVQELLAKKDEIELQEHWNEEALSPYISYIEDEETYVVYFEDSRSLSYKLDFVNQLNLGGVAIWALGYEGDSRELWDVIERKVVLK